MTTARALDRSPGARYCAGMGSATAALLASRAPVALAQPASAIRRGGTFVESINWTYPTLDAHLEPAVHGRLRGHVQHLGTLRVGDPKTGEQKVVGDLADSWEQPDAKTIVFKLKPGVTFHDGTACDAEVAAWNVLRVRDHPKSQWKTQLAVLESAEALNKSTCDSGSRPPARVFSQHGLRVRGSRLHALEGRDGQARRGRLRPEPGGQRRV